MIVYVFIMTVWRVCLRVRLRLPAFVYAYTSMYKVCLYLQVLVEGSTFHLRNGNGTSLASRAAGALCRL